METKHTEGPWTVRNNMDGAAMLIGNSRHLATIVAEDSDDEANAKLIAAAPDLLSLLTNIIEGRRTGTEGRVEVERWAIQQAVVYLQKHDLI